MKIGEDTSSIFFKKKILVERSHQPFSIQFLIDSSIKTLVLQPQNSFNYYTNILNYGVGFIWDKKSPKRYTYQKHIYYDRSNEEHIKPRFQPKQKGAFEAVFSLPLLNNFSFLPQGESRKSNSGTLGIGVGFDYYLNSKNYLELKIGDNQNIYAMDFVGLFEDVRSNYLAVSGNIINRNFTSGIGFQGSKNTWEIKYSPSFNAKSPYREPVSKTIYSLGLILKSHYRISNPFYLGIEYRPSFFILRSKKWNYEHVLALEFQWKFKI